jgi:membrane-bound lytic murein transglycosylase B
MDGVIKNTAIVFVITAFVFLGFGTQKTYAAFDCLTLTTSSSQSDRDYCQNELNQIEAELTKLLDLQKQQQAQTGTLTGDVNYLTSQINALKTKIQARALVVAQLKVNITEKVKTINTLSDKIENEHESLAQLIRKANKFDDENITQVILSNENLSGFYDDLESYLSLGQAVKDAVDVISGVKKQTEVAKQDLEKKQNAEIDAKAELESAQKTVAKSEADKKQLLAISKQTEAAYQQLAAEKKVQADKIRNALFPLANTSQKIEFGTALAYANEAQKLTGIDPAFLLAVLTQESNLGSNVGQCYLTDQTTGSGVGKNTGTPFSNVMKPMGLTGRKGDVEDFLRITSMLGLTWNITAVSCPISGVGGYGGAMGPAQFIPTTWALFENRLKGLLGRDVSPWEPKDAFMASSLYLTDLGGIGTSVSAQNRAACKYYGSGGTSCYYSQSVQKLKTTIQANIDLL